jgi:hypothetical protein
LQCPQAQAIFPESVRLAGNNLRHLFELPVVFFVPCLTVYVAGKTDSFFVASAWMYVGLRALHSAIHVGLARADDVRNFPVALAAHHPPRDFALPLCQRRLAARDGGQVKCVDFLRGTDARDGAVHMRHQPRQHALLRLPRRAGQAMKAEIRHPGVLCAGEPMNQRA